MMEKDEGEEELAIHRQVYRAIGPKRLETSCHSCLRPFSITLRRHHCRRCGRATCSECSSKTRLLKSHNYGEEKVRHCDECYEKGDEISRLCLKGDSKLQFKSRVLFSMRGKRKIYEVRTYLVHENFSVNVERMYEDFYWLHKSLLSEHPKQRLPRLVLSDEESVTRYVNAILTHELLISNASSVRPFTLTQSYRAHVKSVMISYFYTRMSKKNYDRYVHFSVSRPELRSRYIREEMQQRFMKRTVKMKIVVLLRHWQIFRNFQEWIDGSHLP